MKDKLKTLAFENNMDYFGVGSVDRWAHAPVGRRPNDLLPEAQSVIVMGIKIPKGSIESNRRVFKDGLRHGIFTYMLFGYNLLNEVMEKAATKVALYLNETQKSKVYFIPASIPRDEHLMMGEMSNRHSAVCAGLAQFGWNGLALTPEVGPRVRWVQILTDYKLEPDPLLKGPKLCDRTKCRVCIDVCPVSAFSEKERVELKIADQIYTYSKLNRPRCRTCVTGLAKGSAGRLQMDIPENVHKVEDWLSLAYKDIRWNKMELIASMCGKCMTMCPVGQ